MLLEQPWGGGHGQAEPAVTVTLASSFTFHDLSTEGSPHSRTLDLAVVQRPGGDQAEVRHARGQSPQLTCVL